MRFNSTCLRRRQQQVLCLLFVFVASVTLYLTFGSLLVSWATHSLVPVTIRPSRPTHTSSSLDVAPKNTKILLVSAFFPLSKSKHSIADYSAWLSQFLARITTPVYFYCPPSLAETILSIRGDLPIVLDTRFENAFEIPPLQGRKVEYEKMWERDREKSHHNPELYAIWAAKPYLLANALEQLYPIEQYEGSSSVTVKQNREKLGFVQGSIEGDIAYAFWTDAGSFRRTHSYVEWPSLERLDNVWRESAEEGSGNFEAKDRVFFPVQRLPEASMSLWIESLGPVDNDVSEGSFFGGPPRTAKSYADAYYAYHDHYLAQHIFVGKDQTLINSLFLLFPERFITMWHGDPLAPAASRSVIGSWGADAAAKWNPWSTETEFILGQCGDQWYYYQFYLASPEEQARMAKYWLEKWDWNFWKKEWWTRWWASKKEKENCRVTRTLDMPGFLRRAFGESWRPPRRTLAVDF